MRLPFFLRTLSSRIVLGFAVLIATFGAVSALTVYNISLVREDIRILSERYAQLQVASKELAERQSDLHQYLKEELTGEPTVARAQNKVKTLRAARDVRIAKVQAILAKPVDIPVGHESRIQSTQDRVDGIVEDAQRTASLYDQLLPAPPLDKNAPPPGAAADPARDAQLKVLKQLRGAEQSMLARAGALQAKQQRDIDWLVRRIDRNQGEIRTYAVVFGVVAVTLGLLMAVFAAFTLRPLRRLRDAAGRIARGDYASRIDERGPTEVSDLAREFNVMGRAVEERERELVRSERLVAVGKMAAMITHEVRNPLSSIGLNTELLTEELEALPPERAAEARALCRAINAEVVELAREFNSMGR
ncbi:MAG TPA: HAMP domain-containing protein, partial [Kofleriaceae bacterium]|nr:HAMP domain-containing protein [Kofleriaceae bacterium]